MLFESRHFVHFPSGSRFCGLLLASLLAAVAQGREDASFKWEHHVNGGVEAFVPSGSGASGGLWNAWVDLSLCGHLPSPGAGMEQAFHVQVLGLLNQRREQCFGDKVPAFNPVSGLHAGNGLRLFNCNYELAWSSGEGWLRIGQLALDDDFMGSEHAAFFMNSSFGAMPSLVATPLAVADGGGAGFPIFPVAAPGVLLRFPLGGGFALMTGAYHGNPGVDEEDNHGWSWERPASLLWISELSWQGRLLGKDCTLLAGLSRHGGRFDKLHPEDGYDAASPGRGLGHLHLGQDLTLVTGEGEGCVVGAFWRYGRSLDCDRSVVAWYADAGFVWTGPIPARGSDQLGLAVARTHFTEDWLRTGDGSGRHAWEDTVELSYLAQLNEHWSVQVDCQCLLHCPRVEEGAGRGTAVVFGLRTAFSY